MIRSLLLDSGIWGAALGLVLFLALFVGMVVWVFRPGARRTYEHSAEIPLDDCTGREGPPLKDRPAKGA